MNKPTVRGNTPALYYAGKNTDVVFVQGNLHKETVKASTVKQYEKSLKQLETAGLNMPCSVLELYDFIESSMATYSLSTIKVRLAAINWWYETRFKISPTKDDLIVRTMKAARNKKQEAKERTKKVKPLTRQTLRLVNSKLLEEDGLPAKRDRAIILFMYYGALRRSEVGELAYIDAEINDKGIVVKLLNTKTGNFEIYIPANNQEPNLCAVIALKHWLRESEHPLSKESPLFTSFYRGKKPSWRFMSGEAVRTMIKGRLEQSGHPEWDGFSGHSPRRGFATDGIDAGVNPVDVAKNGRWSLNMVMEYADRQSSTTGEALINQLNEDNHDESQ